MTSCIGMDSRSRGLGPGASRPRPPAELLAKLRAGKEALRERRRTLPLPEKVRQLLELQRIQVPLLARRRPLRSWERPWDVTP
jgi:hypothetical protein